MYAVRFLALAIVISSVVGLGACSKTETAAADSTTASAQQGSVSNISNDELQALLDKKVTLIDIRLPEEWQQTGIVADSHRITLFQKDGSVTPDFLAKVQKCLGFRQKGDSPARRRTRVFLKSVRSCR